MRRKSLTLTLATAALLGLLAAPWTATAQNVPCGAAQKMRASLADRYHEVPVAAGLGANGTLVEVYAATSGSFTIMVTHPTGISCLLAAGDDFQHMMERLTPAKTDPAA